MRLAAMFFPLIVVRSIRSFIIIIVIVLATDDNVDNGGSGGDRYILVKSKNHTYAHNSRGMIILIL